jgi:hypothetical protein
VSVSGWAFAGTPDGSVPEREPHADAVSPASTQSNVMERSRFLRLKPVSLSLFQTSIQTSGLFLMHKRFFLRETFLGKDLFPFCLQCNVITTPKCADEPKLARPSIEVKAHQQRLLSWLSVALKAASA